MARESLKETPFVPVDIKDSPQSIHERLSSLTSKQGTQEAEFCYVMHAMSTIDPTAQEPRWKLIKDNNGKAMYKSWKDYVSEGIDVNDKKASAFVACWDCAERVNLSPEDFGSEDPIIWRRFRELVPYIRRGDIDESNASEWLDDCRKSSVYRVKDLADRLVEIFKKEAPDSDGLVSFKVKMTPEELDSSMQILDKAKEKFETDAGGSALAKVMDEWLHLATAGRELVSNAQALQEIAASVFSRFGVHVLFLSADGAHDVSTWRLYRGYNKKTNKIEAVIASAMADAKEAFGTDLDLDEEIIRGVIIPEITNALQSLPPLTEATESLVKLMVSQGKLTSYDVVKIMKAAAEKYPRPADLERYDAVVNATIKRACGQ